MTKGGYGIIYKATWLSYNETVILKRFENSKNNNKYFLNELKSNQHCFNRILYDYIIKIYGFTKDPELEDYILVMKYASEGDLHKYLQKNFTNLKWNSEIFKGSAFSKEADIYSFGMIMWELTTSCKPFANVEHDIHLIYKILDEERPKITKDTPECYANLMKSCWVPDSKKRPLIKEIYLTLDNWLNESKYKEEFVQIEEKRNKLIKLKKIGTEFAEKYHSKAIYTSRPLSTLISKCLSTNSSSTISFGNNQDYTYHYISKEKELDIDIKRAGEVDSDHFNNNSSITLYPAYYKHKRKGSEDQADSSTQIICVGSVDDVPGKTPRLELAFVLYTMNTYLGVKFSISSFGAQTLHIEEVILILVICNGYFVA
ncbi:kinase-like domain-containing protein [Rhizophagus diaphanus]|nr:kinase-like domain-containing protein [Rhizophagus diaphanus] [Rhizophagus sp. MUCL 43196]